MNRILKGITGAGVALLLLVVSANAKDDQIRIYISADMEGITASVTEQQLGPSGFEYERFRRIMTAEVLAAIEGARAGGADEIVVSDSHGNMQNILVDEMPDDVLLIRGPNRPLSMMEGIQDGKFDGVIFIGYHASASNPEGVRAHTMSSARLSEVILNGIPATEGLWNAAIAGDYGVPVIMISGGDAATAEVREAVGDMETAVVKEAIGFHAAKTLSPKAGQALIREKAQAAVERIADFRPFVVANPRVELMFHYYQPAQMLALLPWIERTGARSISFEAANMTEAENILAVILGYDSNAKP